MMHQREHSQQQSDIFRQLPKVSQLEGLHELPSLIDQVRVASLHVPPIHGCVLGR